MKPFLYYPGGCEFELIIHEQKFDRQKYFDFDYFRSFEHRAKEQQVKPCMEWFLFLLPDIEKAPVLSA